MDEERYQPEILIMQTVTFFAFPMALMAIGMQKGWFLPAVVASVWYLCSLPQVGCAARSLHLIAWLLRKAALIGGAWSLWLLMSSFSEATFLQLLVIGAGMIALGSIVIDEIISPFIHPDVEEVIPFRKIYPTTGKVILWVIRFGMMPAVALMDFLVHIVTWRETEIKMHEYVRNANRIIEPVEQGIVPVTGNPEMEEMKYLDQLSSSAYWGFMLGKKLETKLMSDQNKRGGNERK
jgi:hypothetical protein